MHELAARLATAVKIPLMFDSTEWEKMEAGLEHAGGKSLLNSTNYEDGEPRFLKVLDIAKRYGAGIVVGLIYGGLVYWLRKHRDEKLLTQAYAILAMGFATLAVYGGGHPRSLQAAPRCLSIPIGSHRAALQAIRQGLCCSTSTRNGADLAR